VRLLDPCFDPLDTTRRRAEIGALGLDATGSPVTVGVANRFDGKVSSAVLIDVRRAAGHRLDFAGAPVRGTPRIASASVVKPVRGVQAGARSAVEVVAE